MYTYTWYQWIAFFYIYCFFGWIFESTYVSLKTGKFVNRGFLRLPMLPLYGTGAVMMLFVSIPVQGNLFLVYLSGVAGATVLEYVTGFAMERLFKMKYWDYSDKPFNLDGYICLSSSIAWGFLTIFLTDVIHKPIANMVTQLNPVWNLVLIGFISVFFIADSIQSTREALDLGRALETLTKIRAELDEIQVQMALLKSETTQRVSDYKEETALKMASLKADTALKMEEFREETSQKMAMRIAELKEETSQRLSSSIPDISALSQRLQALSEKRQKLSQHMGFYRKGILRGNPSASSNRFAEALKELKEALESR